MLSSHTAYWSTHNQYSLLLAPILAFATVDVVSRIGRMARSRDRVVAWLSLLTLICGAGATAIQDPPQAFRNDRSAEEATRAKKCLRAIPPSASVAASNVLVPHLTHRALIYPLFERTQEQYLAVDVSNGIGRLAVSRIGSRDKHPRYAAVCSGGGVAVFKRAS
jgi:uncharacterized membrane protein